jgi:CysZ protein
VTVPGQERSARAISQPLAAKRKAIGFFAGLAYPVRGARFVYRQHPELARIWLLPIVLTTILLGLTVWLALHAHAGITAAIWTTPAGGFLRFVHSVLEWLVGLVLTVAGALAVALSANVIAAPFNDALSEAVENIHLGRAASPFSLGRALRGVGRSCGLELLKLGLYLSVMGPLFVLSLLLPAVGTAIYTLASVCATALFFAVDYMDWPASRRDLPLQARVALARRNLRSVLGLGLAIELLLFVPLLNLLVMPAAVAGATLLFIDLQQPASASEPAPGR